MRGRYALITQCRLNSLLRPHRLTTAACHQTRTAEYEVAAATGAQCDAWAVSETHVPSKHIGIASATAAAICRARKRGVCGRFMPNANPQTWRQMPSGFMS